MIKKIKLFIKNYFFQKKIMIASSHFFNARLNYNKIRNINNLDFKVFSQNGEDGIIDYLLFQLKIKKPKYVEIGVGDYTESNTRYLFETMSPKGIIFDCIENFKERVKENVKMWKGDLKIIKQSVNSDNILNLLKKNNFINNIDLFSLDVDGIDYWIINSMPKNFSKIVILEYNPIFGPKLKVTVPNKKNFDRSKYHYSNLCFGASINALIYLMNKKNFVFVGSNLTNCNAFFVSKKYIKNIRLKLPNTNNLNFFTISNIRESRSKQNKLTYLSGLKKINKIRNCELIDLDNKNYKKVKIKNLLKKNYKII
tara:strand:- start:363 stop:1295 length:933 start_codon:yes stop_codon:yes gene_type:complete